MAAGEDLLMDTAAPHDAVVISDIQAASIPDDNYVRPR